MGAKYSGIQPMSKLNEAPLVINGKPIVTIQEVVENALEKITKNQSRIAIASRTDKGVHAYRNAFTFEITRSIEKPVFTHEILRKAINYHLYFEDIRVIDVHSVGETFNCRKHAIQRTYLYKLLFTGKFGNGSLFENKRHWIINERLDKEKLTECAKVFEGTHSFKNFCRKNSIHPEDYDYTRHMQSICLHHRQLSFVDSPYHNMEDEIILEFKAKSYLWHQIRILMHYIIEMYTGRVSLDTVNSYLLCERVNKDKQMGPPHGLYLADIKYDESLWMKEI